MIDDDHDKDDDDDKNSLFVEFSIPPTAWGHLRTNDKTTMTSTVMIMNVDFLCAQLSMFITCSRCPPTPPPPHKVS